jgi:hypothetical protein
VFIHPASAFVCPVIFAIGVELADGVARDARASMVGPFLSAVTQVLSAIKRLWSDAMSNISTWLSDENSAAFAGIRQSSNRRTLRRFI